jgi:hypothetical protein
MDLYLIELNRGGTAHPKKAVRKILMGLRVELHPL